jgi:hypothetical protein
MAVAEQKTLKDVGHPKWLADVLASDKNLKADAAKYKLDPATILTTDQHKKLGFLTYNTAVTKGAADLRRAIAERDKKTNGTDIKGVLAGIRDVYGSKAPVRFTILRKDGGHVDVSQFGTSLKKDGKKVDVSVPANVTVSALYDEEYDSYSVIALENYAPVKFDDFVTGLIAIAKTPAEIEQSDHKKIVVVKGRIEFVNPVPKWKDGKQDGEETVWQANQRKTPVESPIVRLRLQGEDVSIGGLLVPVYVSITLQRMKNAAPTISVPDIDGACQYAMTVDEDPNEQAKQIGDILRGREVVAVGRVSSFDPKHDKIYINVDACTLIQTADETGYVPSIKNRRSGDDIPEEPEPEQASLDFGGDAEEEATVDEAAVDEAEPEGGDATPTVTAAAVERYLEAVCMVSGISPGTLNAEEIWNEKYKDAMSFEVFEVILSEYVKKKTKKTAAKA